MDDRPKHLPRRKPVPLSPQFSDFSLQPLYLDNAENLSARAAQNVNTHAWWTPCYLTKTALLAFVGVFISFVVTLAGLFAYSSKNQGLSTASDHDFYLWTYGPTAVLTFVAAFWGQVIYRTKQLMPWKAMANRPQAASKSVLLDYVSPMSPVALWTAFSNAHHVVSLVIVSSVLLTATTILSTGLFMLQYTGVTTHNISLAVTNKFDWSNFDWKSLDARPTAVVYATLLGLEYPDGTTAHYAVQDFTDMQGSNATLNGTVDTFSADLECENANLKVTTISEWDQIGSPSGNFLTINITSATCTTADVSFDTGFLFDAIKPVNKTFDITFGFGRFTDCVEPEEHRLLISTGTIRVIEKWNGTEYGDIGLSLPYDKMLRIVNSTNVLCTPHYRIAKSQVVKKSNATSRSVFESITLVDERESQAVMATNLARGVFQSINDPTAQAQGFYSNSSGFPTLPDTFFTLLVQEQPFFENAASANEFWLQSENLVQYVNLFYGSVAAQVAAQKLLTPTNAGILGSVTVNEPRLFVRVLSFTLMEACLVMLALTAAFLLSYASRPVLPLDPGSISGVASILAESAELCQMVKGNDSSSRSYFEAQLGENMYHTCPNGGKPMRIEVSRTSATTGTSTGKTDAPNPVPIRWWQPMALSPLSRLLVISAPLAYIAVLEVLFTMSQSGNGPVDVDTSSWTHYGWTYVPALAMVCLHILYVSVNFNVRLLSPYATMKAKSAQASISVHDHPFSRIALHEVFIATKRGQSSVLAVTLAALLAPLLTIAVSGLYTAENYHQDVGVRQLTGWNFHSSGVRNSTLVQNVVNQLNEPDPTNYLQGGVTAPFTDLIITSNLSYPQWSFDELAFPLVQVTNSKEKSTDSSAPLKGLLDVPIPAIRGVLNCSVIPKKDVNLTYATYAPYPSAIYNETGYWAMAGNRQCLNYSVPAGLSSGSDLPTAGCRVALSRTSSTYSPGGCTLAPQLLFLPPQTDHLQYFGYFAPNDEQENSNYCPVYSGMIGSTTSREVQDYTWFSCSTDVESVMTQTTFTLPDYSISMVQVDETSASRVASRAEIEVTNKTDPRSFYEVNFTGPNAALYDRNGILDVNQYLTYYNISDGQNYDNFFSALVYGRDGVPTSEMMGTANVPRLFSAVQHLWRNYLAQQFRTSMWFLSADPSDIKVWAPRQPLNATLMDSNAYRLKQSVVSTRILQGILGALSFCAIITFLLMDTRAVLPNNPSSIAAVASLLAGSEMLNVIASKENTLDEQHKWDGFFFSLGFWPLPGGGKRFGIDIGKAEKAS